MTEEELIEKIDNDLYCLRFAITLSIFYHEKRELFFDRLSNIFIFFLVIFIPVFFVTLRFEISYLLLMTLIFKPSHTFGNKHYPENNLF